MTTDAEWDAADTRRLRDLITDEIAARIDALAATTPNLDARIVGRLIERAPEILADLLDDIEEWGRTSGHAQHDRSPS